MSAKRCARRDFLKRIGLGAAVLSMPRGLAAADAKARPTKRPNIVLVIADDLTWHDVGCYGSKQVNTPNIDKLAKQGMKFNYAFTATAMCSPTRQQLYTGMFPVRNGAYPNHSKVKPGTKSMVHHLKALGYRVGLIGKKHIGPVESFPFEKGGANFLTRDKDQPFCLVVASHNPHAPWPEPDGYDPDTITVPPYLVDNKETRLALCRYYTEVTLLDGEVGKWMKAVDETGAANNTIFIFTSEQGAQFPFGKWTCYDIGLRVAMVVRWPKRVKAGSTTDAMVQYVDVVPTLIEAAGAEPGKIDTGRPDANGKTGFDGRSFLNVLLGKTDKHNEVVFGVHTTQGIISGKPYPIRSIRNRTHKYIMNLMPDSAFQNIVTENDRQGLWKAWLRDAKSNKKAAFLAGKYQHRPAEELYNLTDDPYEMKNLAGQAKNRTLMDELKGKLQAWMAQQGDEGIATELRGRKRKDRKKTAKRKPKPQQ